jgi:hypothetical protein
MVYNAPIFPDGQVWIAQETKSWQWEHVLQLVPAAINSFSKKDLALACYVKKSASPLNDDGNLRCPFLEFGRIDFGHAMQGRR